MAVNRGKQFEDIVKSSVEATTNAFIYRLYDTTNGYSGIANISDFIICSSDGKMRFVECKSLHGNRLSIYSHSSDVKHPHDYGAFTNTQWKGMLDASRYDCVYGYALVWWIDHDVTVFLNIKDLDKWRSSGHKSISYAEAEQLGTVVQGKKKRVFFDYDFKGVL